MSDRLKRFHRYALSRIAFYISFIYGLFFSVVWGLAPDSQLNSILGPLTSVTVATGTFLFLEKLICTRFWRIAYPEFDFNGTWNGYSEYCHQYGSLEEGGANFKSFKKDHSIRFKQDCLSVMVEYDQTGPYHGWCSTVATLVEENGVVGLRYAYKVNYCQGNKRDMRLPIRSRGLEEIFVVQGKEGERPEKVSGLFSHTVGGPKPMYSGAVVFERNSEEMEPSPCLFEILIVKYLLKPPA